MTLNKTDYEQLLDKTLTRWRSDIDLIEFRNYFVKQWIHSDFNNWQIFRTPTGYAKTNYPLEQFNCRIKDDFTKQIKYHLKSSLKVFAELINFESDHIKPILLIPRVKRLLRETSALIVKKKLLVADGDGNFKNEHDDATFSSICMERKCCSCSWYLDKAICKHLVAACIQTNKNLSGLVFMPKTFVSRWRRRKLIHASPVKAVEVAKDVVDVVPFLPIKRGRCGCYRNSKY